jgi:hypothetical protein
MVNGATNVPSRTVGGVSTLHHKRTRVLCYSQNNPPCSPWRRPGGPPFEGASNFRAPALSLGLRPRETRRLGGTACSSRPHAMIVAPLARVRNGLGTLGASRAVQTLSAAQLTQNIRPGDLLICLSTDHAPRATRPRRPRVRHAREQKPTTRQSSDTRAQREGQRVKHHRLVTSVVLPPVSSIRRVRRGSPPREGGGAPSVKDQGGKNDHDVGGDADSDGPGAVARRRGVARAAPARGGRGAPPYGYDSGGGARGRRRCATSTTII